MRLCKTVQTTISRASVFTSIQLWLSHSEMADPFPNNFMVVKIEGPSYASIPHDTTHDGSFTIDSSVCVASIRLDSTSPVPGKNMAGAFHDSAMSPPQRVASKASATAAEHCIDSVKSPAVQCNLCTAKGPSLRHAQVRAAIEG